MNAAFTQVSTLESNLQIEVPPDMVQTMNLRLLRSHLRSASGRPVCSSLMGPSCLFMNMLRINHYRWSCHMDIARQLLTYMCLFVSRVTLVFHVSEIK